MKYSRIVLSACHGLFVLIISFAIAWILLAKVDFLYGFWHDNVGIADGIEEYGPQNRFKPGFADTSRQQRLELFAGINQAIHRGGLGLDSLTYSSPSSNGEQSLLREPEVVHLQDVANLLEVLKAGVLFSLILLAATTYISLKRYQALPELKTQGLGLGGVVLVIACVLLVAGPETVFNTLHIWIFPAEHQWFFYYQDSLMSTMMLAPQLFGWIALVWGALGIVLFVLLQWFAIVATRKMKL